MGRGERDVDRPDAGGDQAPRALLGTRWPTTARAARWSCSAGYRLRATCRTPGSGTGRAGRGPTGRRRGPSPPRAPSTRWPTTARAARWSCSAGTTQRGLPAGHLGVGRGERDVDRAPPAGGQARRALRARDGLRQRAPARWSCSAATPSRASAGHLGVGRGERDLDRTWTAAGGQPRRAQRARDGVRQRARQGGRCSAATTASGTPAGHLGVGRGERDLDRPDAGDGSKPSARDWHAMAYDSARGKVVMFGGRRRTLGSAGHLGVGRGEPGPGPTGRRRATAPGAAGHAMAYDSARGKVVMFGGHGTRASCRTPGSGTGRAGAGPTGRRRDQARRALGHAMAYDSARGKVVMFGG